MDDGVGEVVAVERHGGVEPELVRDAVVRGGVELRALGARHDEQVAPGLEARRHRPFHRRRVVDIHILVHHRHLLHIGMGGEGGHDDIAPLALLCLPQLHIEVVAAHAAAREMHVEHGRAGALQMRRNGGLARNGAEQQVLHRRRHDGVEDGPRARRDRLHLDGRVLAGRPVILRELAERPFGLAHARQQAPLDDDLGAGGHAHIVGRAFHHVQRRAVQRARHLQLVMVDRQDRLAGEQGQRVHADRDGYVERLPGRLGGGEEMMQVPRQDQDAHPPRPRDLETVDRDVLNAGPRVARNHQPRRDIGPGVERIVLRDRKRGGEVGVAVDAFLARAVGHLPPGKRLLGCGAETVEHRAGLDAHRLGNPAPVRNEARDHRYLVAASVEAERRRKEHGLARVPPLGERGEGEVQRDARPGDGEPVRGLQPVEPGTEGAVGHAERRPSTGLRMVTDNGAIALAHGLSPGARQRPRRAPSSASPFRHAGSR